MPYNDLQKQQQTSYRSPQLDKGTWNPPPPCEPRSRIRAPYHSSNGRGTYGRGSFNNNNRFKAQQQEQQRLHNDAKIELPNSNGRHHLFIRYAELSIRRAIVASADPGVSRLTTLLEFQPFSEPSLGLAHLSGESLHILALDQNHQRENCSGGSGSSRSPERTGSIRRFTEFFITVAWGHWRTAAEEAEAYDLLDVSRREHREVTCAAEKGSCPELCTQVKNLKVGVPGDEGEHPIECLSAREVADLVVDNLYSDLSIALDCVRSYLESKFWVGLKPKLWLRFGRMLFHSRQNRSNLAEHTPFDAEDLEKSLLGSKGSVLKSFDSSVSQDCYRKVRALIGWSGHEVPVNKEKFTIQVADASQPRVALLLICKRRLQGDRTRLTLWKIKTDPLRHMVADVACMAKNLDLRLILTTRQKYTGQKSMLQTIVDKAVFDVKAEGGLYWPLGSTSSGPYSVTGVSHVYQTTLTSKGHKWKLRHANRTSLNASAARFSYEIDVTADVWADHFETWKEVYVNDQKREICQTDCQFEPLATLLCWVWKNCI